MMTFSRDAAHMHLSLHSDYVQQNLNDSNIDDSFTTAYSNSFLRPTKILPLAQENKYLGYFRHNFLFYQENICCTHYNRLIEAILTSTFNKPLYYRRSKIQIYPHLPPDPAL